jgi:hydroxyacylglutathione hydrolase
MMNDRLSRDLQRHGKARSFAHSAALHATVMAIATGFLSFQTFASTQIVPGSLDVRWQQGAQDCKITTEESLQVHAYNPQTYILRQSLCASFEGNFIYLLIGLDQALLIDTGAVADPQKMPLAKQVLELLPEKENGKLPLLVVHTHSHTDHRDGDPQFQSLHLVEVVPWEAGAMQTHFGFVDWPNGIAHIELGGRTVDVIPTPGHHPFHLVFYDRQTGLLFSGDFLLPGRLLIDDVTAYEKSALRVVDFFKTRPLTHILGGHIELDEDGRVYGWGSHYHPKEHRLELAKADLLALPSALATFNGFYATHRSYVVVNPIHNLELLASGALAILLLVVWGVRKWVRRRRTTVAQLRANANRG